MPDSIPTKHPPLDWVREAGKVDLVLQDITSKLGKRRRRRVRAAGVALGATCVAMLAFWAVPTLRDTATVLTPPAQRQTLALADGSTAELNAHTDLRTDFRYGRRIVRLDRGEAFFSVAKDSAHPFFVETPAGTIRVTGTHFNVRLTDDRRPEVTLLEGAVTIEGVGAEPVHLVPGQRFSAADSAAGVRTLSAADLEAVAAWRQGRLVLDQLTLADAAARFATYHGKEIYVAPEIAGLRMGGSCRLDDLPAFAEFLAKALSVDVLTQPDGSLRIRAR